MIHVPTLLWFGYPFYDDMDMILDGLGLSGMFLSLIVMVTGSSNMIIMTLLWMLYFSIFSVGQNWFSFGWESQLLETGFLAIWCVPVLSLKKFPKSLPSPWVICFLILYIDVLEDACLMSVNKAKGRLQKKISKKNDIVLKGGGLRKKSNFECVNKNDILIGGRG